jgi:hypothetical protein
MAFQVSPGVQINEQDLTNIVPAVAATTGGYVGPFVWGPVMDVQTVTDEAQLVSEFGRPVTAIAASWLSAANYLSYANQLKLVRVVGAAAKNAVASGTAILIKNLDDWDNNFSTGAASVGHVAAKWAGTLGNSLQVSVADGVSWLITLTGTVAANTSSKTVSGTGTAFLTETHVGAVILNSANAVVGVVASIASDNLLTLAANARITLVGSTIKSKWAYAAQFDSQPTTSASVARAGGSLDEMHIIVLDKTGAWTGTAGTILEKFAFVSKASDAKTEQGSTNYYKNVLRGSRYIWWMGHPSVGTDWGTLASASGAAYDSLPSPLVTTLSGGVDDLAPSDASIMLGLDLLSDPETIDVSLLFQGPASATVGQYIIQIAEARKDCIGFVSPLLSSVLNNIGNESESVLADLDAFSVNSSYGFMDSGWKQQYDKYNDTLRWVPLNADMAGLTARTELTNDAWWSPAGFNRGVVKNVVKLAWNPKKAYRDELYKAGVNPVASFPGEGTVLYGDKTMLTKPSAFGFINVRRLFIVLEKAIAVAAKYQLFEFNDTFTRAQFRNMVEPFLRDIKGRRGVTDFEVVCDSTNNTGSVVDRAEFVADIYVKPNRSINGITLNFIAVRSSVSFEEIIGG